LTLPAPNLDDRRFQSLVDDAKRLVMQRCPEWTDHNVSDPGVTLIETFAYMTDQLIYRLNRVPDLNYVKFLELVGVHLFPPTAASCNVTFWLSAPQDETIRVPDGVEVATPRGDTDAQPVVFTVDEALDIVACELSYICSIPASGTWRNHTDTIKLAGFSCFSANPVPGEVLLVGLSAAVPRCAVNLRFDCRMEGIGVDPSDPPLVWEAFDGTDWVECEVDSDSTGGLNRQGDVVLHVPASHTLSVIQSLRAGWIRARLVDPRPDQPFYSNSPTINSLEAFTVGGTTKAYQAERISEQVIGVSDGVAGERFQLEKFPVVGSGEPFELEVSDEEEGWQTWTEVTTFAQSGPADRHFVLDRTFGEVSLGPLVRNPDGSVTQYGAVPAKGSVLRARPYRCGGGRQGNVSKGAVRVMRNSIPFVSRVENRAAATGGVDGETVDEAKVRGPVLLRTLGRAVTAEDYEELARAAAPQAGRIRAVPASGVDDAGGVRVLVVPSVADDEDGLLPFERLVPDAQMLSDIATALDRRRTIGARVVVEPPAYQGVTVVAALTPRPWSDAARLKRSATQALYDYLHPLTGGMDGTGWPFGRPVLIGEIFAVLQNLPGVEIVDDVRLFAANPLTGERGQPAQRVDVAPNALVFSYQHQVRVEGA